MYYDQLFDNTALDRLETFVDAAIDRTFPQFALQKPVPNDVYYGEGTSRTFMELCERAAFDDDKEW